MSEIKMNKVIDIISQIIQTSSRNEKISIIRSNSNNELFKDNLVFLLDGSITTGISKTKLSKNVGIVKDLSNSYTEDDWWGALRTWLKDHNTGTTREIISCQRFLKFVPEDHREFYEQMITKKLRLGCDYKTVNEAIPNLIWTYETQQAYPINDKNKPKQGEWFSLSQKLNGINGGFIDGKCYSRQGKIITGLNHIISDLHQLGLDECYVNGELIRNNHDGIPDDENFQLTTSIINSDMVEKNTIKFIFYEIIPKDSFYKGKSDIKYKQRLHYYKIISDKINKLGLKNISYVKHFYEGTDQNKIQEYLDYADTQNMEGIMLNKDTYWEAKRNNGILKIKSFKSCDILCIGIEEGDGKYSGKLGRINCNYKGFTLGVGSGFTDEQRKIYWEHPDMIVGNIVTVKYKVETKNKNGGISVQFPTFIAIRNDKTEESYY